MVDTKYVAEYTPKRGTDGSACIDLCSTDEYNLYPGAVRAISTGFRVAIPDGYVGLLFVRSSLGARGICLANGVGVIDSDYRGEVKVLCCNIGYDGPYKINVGDRVGQLMLVRKQAVNWIPTDTLDKTERGTGGFGSTGK